MPEIKLVPTKTDLLVSLPFLYEKTYYELGSELPNIISGFIAFEEGVKNTVTFKLGELGFDMKNYPTNIDVILNSNGELELILDTGDKDRYSINSNGDLIYTPVS